MKSHGNSKRSLACDSSLDFVRSYLSRLVAGARPVATPALPHSEDHFYSREVDQVEVSNLNKVVKLDIIHNSRAKT